jgi:hypothetical protein
MEIDALEQLISEDVMVQGQISCVMASELSSWSLKLSPELLPVSSPEEMRSTSTTLLLESSLEESALTSMRVDRFFLRIEEKNPASPWRTSLESANLAHARLYGFLPRADEEPTSSMEHRGRCMGAAHWDGSSSSPRNFTLLAGAVDSTKEDRRGCGRGASSLQNLPLESWAILATKTRKTKAGEGDRRRKAGQSVY